MGPWTIARLEKLAASALRVVPGGGSSCVIGDDSDHTSS